MCVYQSASKGLTDCNELLYGSRLCSRLGRRILSFYRSAKREGDSYQTKGRAKTDATLFYFLYNIAVLYFRFDVSDIMKHSFKNNY